MTERPRPQTTYRTLSPPTERPRPASERVEASTERPRPAGRVCAGYSPCSRRSRSLSRPAYGAPRPARIVPAQTRPVVSPPFVHQDQQGASATARARESGPTPPRIRARRRESRVLTAPLWPGARFIARPRGRAGRGCGTWRLRERSERRLRRACSPGGRTGEPRLAVGARPLSERSEDMWRSGRERGEGVQCLGASVPTARRTASEGVHCSVASGAVSPPQSSVASASASSSVTPTMSRSSS